MIAANMGQRGWRPAPVAPPVSAILLAGLIDGIALILT
jgi:hypothetical protein